MPTEPEDDDANIARAREAIERIKGQKERGANRRGRTRVRLLREADSIAGLNASRNSQARVQGSARAITVDAPAPARARPAAVPGANARLPQFEVAQLVSLDRRRVTARNVITALDWTPGTPLVARREGAGVWSLKPATNRAGRTHPDAEVTDARGRITLEPHLIHESDIRNWPGVLAIAARDALWLVDLRAVQIAPSPSSEKAAPTE